MAKQPTRSLLIDESPLMVYPTLATAIGLEEALFVQQLHWYLQYPGRIEWDNRLWVYNTYEKWCEYFPFWSEQQIQRIAVRVEKMGIVVSERIGAAKRDQQKYYTINYEGMARFRESIDLVLESSARSRSKEYPDYSIDDHIRIVSSIISESNDGTCNLDMMLKEQKNLTKESQKNIIANAKNIPENQNSDENENAVDLPVLLTQTGVKTEQTEGITFIDEIKNTHNSDTDHENSGLESDHLNNQTMINAAPQKRKPGRPRNSAAAQATMLPTGDTRAAGVSNSRKVRTSTAEKKEPTHTPEQRRRMADYVAIFEDERGKSYVPKSALAGRVWKEVKELLLYNPSLEDVRNMYRSFAAQPFWSGKNITPITLANNYDEWVAAKRPMNGAKRYVEQTNTPAPKPQTQQADASAVFWTGDSKQRESLTIDASELIF